MYAALHATSSLHARPHRRLIFAVAASALVHAWLAHVNPGASGSQEAKSIPVQELNVFFDAEPVPIVAAPETRSSFAQPEESASTLVRPARAAVPAEDTQRDPSPRALVSVPGVSDPTYYAARDLDVYPAIAPQVVLNFASVGNTGPEKRLQLLLLVNAAGAVDEASVVSAEPPGSHEESVRRAFLLARFTPGERGGRPVKTRLLVEVTFGADR